MSAFICTACGTEFPPSKMPPEACPVCEEERQYVPRGGQTWTTHDTLCQTHRNTFHEYERGLIGIGTEPRFAIGQRALLISTPDGNVLWDCISLIDDATVTLINGLGGLAAIAISHPHFYTAMGRWSDAFGGVPVHLHADDQEWILNPGDNVRLWDGASCDLMPDIALVHCGGHFPGASVLHWADGADGRGVVCAGDTLTVTTDLKFLSFMWSYPNFIPLPAATVENIGSAVEPLAYDRIYGHYFDRVISRDAKAVMKRSVARYLRAIRD